VAASPAPSLRVFQRQHFEASPAEHQRGRQVLHVQNAVENRRLVGARHEIGRLAHARHLPAAGFSPAIVTRRRGQVALRDRQDSRRPTVTPQVMRVN